MGLKPRIAVMQFLQFFIWGSWMPMMGSWWFGTQHWSGADFGATFATMGIASLFMPTIMGMIADRWVSAEKLYSLCLLCSSVLHFMIPQCTEPSSVFWIMLINMCFYMPTLGLAYSISYSSMEKAGMDIVKEYPPVRVWGTVGFIFAMWIISLLKLETSSWIFYVAGVSSAVLGFYALTMPKCPPLGKKDASWFEALGLDAFRVFKDYRMAVFFVFSMFLGVVLQLSNAYGNVFLHSFEELPQYQDSLAVKYPAIIMSISQISETFMILLVPFFLKRFGIKKVMIISMAAWVLRFGFLAFGNPSDNLWMIILSCIIYGMAFDFFNISGSLYTELNAPAANRSSAQGIFMLMTNGIGAIVGSTTGGWMIEKYFTSADNVIQWQGMNGVWIVFSAYAMIVGVVFAIMFKYKHNSQSIAH